MKKLLLPILTLCLAITCCICCTACSKAKTLEENFRVQNIADGSMNYDGFYKKLMDFTLNQQLLNRDMWKQFVDVYRTHEDSEKNMWRCEYWGKTMRGAVLCYKYTQNEDLYNVLEETVKDLLTTQDSDGRFSTYTQDKEFQGWDIWGRKYIMTSLLSFNTICKDANLKKDVDTALRRHADYIVSHLGPDKIDITTASQHWLGVNSASILEPIVNLYEVTNDAKYLDFAKYIVSTGGIRTENGNLIEIVNNTNRHPFEFPEVKAYETMSFFEGVYRYALVTNDEYLKATALKFFDDVDLTEISITGNAGNNEEAFNNGQKMQVVKPERFGQETCVAVTWMRINDLLYKTTGEIRYYENINRTGLNAFLGCVNYFNQPGLDIENATSGKYVDLPFDSYSPLAPGKRGVATGGLVAFKTPLNPRIKYYGCCACIASAAVALISEDSVAVTNDTVRINDYFNGTVDTDKFNLTFTGDYFRDGKSVIKVDSTSDKKLELRIPKWLGKANVTIDGEKANVLAGTYYKTDRALKDINEINIDFGIKVKKDKVEDKVYLTYGDCVLALDTEANPGINLDHVSVGSLDLKSAQLLDNQEDDLVRIKIGKYTFKSYASSGKHWYDKQSSLTVFYSN